LKQNIKYSIFTIMFEWCWWNFRRWWM